MAEHLVPLMTRIVEVNDATCEVIDASAALGLSLIGKRSNLLFTAWLREFSRSILFGRFGDAVSDYWDLKPGREAC
jgi:hypothetical protein